jgi:hypothetical protein
MKFLLILEKHQELLEFLEIKDVINLKIANKSISKLISTKIIKNLIKKVGINPDFRLKFWKSFIRNIK